jgi:hypothetical protein
MAELRCPMCSKVNDPGAEVCSFCGARLKPLVIDTPSDDVARDAHEGATPAEETPEDTIRRAVDDLDRLAGMIEDEEEDLPADVSPSSTLPDWLDRVRPSTPISNSEEEAEVEPIPEEPPETDYLERLRRVDHSVFAEKPKAAPTDGAPDDSESDEAFKTEFLDWLQGVWDEEEAEADGLTPGERFAEKRREDRSEAGAPAEDIADLAPGPFAEEPEEEISPTARESLVEDIVGLAPGDFAEEPEEEIPPTAREPFPEDIVGFDPGDFAEEPEEEPSPTTRETLLGDIADLAAFDFSEESEAEAPPLTFEEGELERAEVEEVAVPPLISDEQFAEQEPQDVDIGSIQVPDWVEDIHEIEAGEPKEETEEGVEISRATIPSWLEDFRPIESLRSMEETEAPEPPAIETIGPLAGLQDVLMAEPVVAIPHALGATETDISVTSQQTEQISILRKLVEEERNQIEPQKVHRTMKPIVQWIVSLVMVVAVTVPMVIRGSIFPSPRWVPHDLETLRSLVETFDSSRPTLVVADYDPGYSAELEAVGSSLLDHLLRRGMPVVTLSTRAPGPALAQRLIDHISVWQDVQAGRDYLHLGYLAGGPTAIQLFASNPRREGLRGFMLPEDRDWESPWQSPILAEVQQFPDFGAVVVITAGTETARTWAEQAAPLAGDTPFIMVLSAGAEPLVRPYYAGSDAHVDAILTGLPSAKANELLNGHEGDASLLWDSFGIGGWLATCFLIVGGVIGTTVTLLRRDGKDEVHV